MEVHEGRVVSTLLENGFLEICAARGIETCIVSPGSGRCEFTRKYSQPDSQWIELPHNNQLTRLETLYLKVGRWLSMRGHTGVRRQIWKQVESRIIAGKAHLETALIKQFQPQVVLSPHVSEGFGRRLVAAAQSLGVETVGNMASWDNPYRPLKSRTDIVTCWSEETKRTLCSLDAYLEDEVKVIGAPAFDAYFGDGGHWSKKELCSHLGLDPNRPIILYATLGQFRPFMDETGTFAGLLKGLDKGLIRGNPQVILRLHPLSRLPYFERFLGRYDLVVSRYTGYEPGMMWAPSLEEVKLAGNLMRHADVCVSPGSTMTIEPAIFDTPTVLPVMNLYTPEAYRAFFKRIWLEGHFKMIVDNDWVPLVYTVEDLAGAVNRAIEDPAWYKHGRDAIRSTILGPLDGRATERLVDLIDQKA